MRYNNSQFADTGGDGMVRLTNREANRLDRSP